SVVTFAIVVVCVLLIASWMVVPQPPVCRSTRFGTLPAAILRPSGWPLMAVPLMNCACVHTDATVVISLMTTLAGGVLPSITVALSWSARLWQRPDVLGARVTRRL